MIRARNHTIRSPLHGRWRIEEWIESREDDSTILGAHACARKGSACWSFPNFYNTLCVRSFLNFQIKEDALLIKCKSQSLRRANFDCSFATCLVGRFRAPLVRRRDSARRGSPTNNKQIVQSVQTTMRRGRSGRVARDLENTPGKERHDTWRSIEVK